MIEMARLHAVPARDVWAYEAGDFTPLRRDNKGHPEAVLGIAIDITAIDYPVGGLRLDMHWIEPEIAAVIKSTSNGTPPTASV